MPQNHAGKKQTRVTLDSRIPRDIHCPAMSPRTTTTMRIDDELLEGLQALKDRDGVPVSEQVRRAIEAWLKEKGIRVKAAPRRVDQTRRKA